MSRPLLALFGLKWNPFITDVPVEALRTTPKLESFLFRMENRVREGGFALVAGPPGTGKSATLRIVADHLSSIRDLRIGVFTRPQCNMADFYRELGDLFGVELSPHNRWASAPFSWWTRPRRWRHPCWTSSGP